MNCGAGRGCPLRSGTFLAEWLTELPAHILEEDNNICLARDVGRGRGPGTQSHFICKSCPRPGAAPSWGILAGGPADGSPRRTDSEIRPSYGSGLLSLAVGLGKLPDPQGAHSPGLFIYRRQGHHLGRRAGEILRDIKTLAPSSIFNKAGWWCSVSGTVVLFLGLREGRLTMFMASVCALQEQLQDPFCLIVCLFDYLFIWCLFIYTYPYFLIIMYLFTGSFIYFLTYVHSYVFIYSLAYLLIHSAIHSFGKFWG